VLILLSLRASPLSLVRLLATVGSLKRQLMTIDAGLMAYYQSLVQHYAGVALPSTANERRARYLDITRLLDQRGPAPSGALAVRAIEMSLDLPTQETSPKRTIPARLYQQKNRKARTLTVFFHGGGWVIGDLDSHDAFCRELALESGTDVMSVHYRLAPEHPFPAPTDDASAALKRCSERLAEWGYAQIAVAGDSAGAHLAAHAAYANQHEVKTAAQLLLYPVVGHDFSYASYTECANGPGLTAVDMQWYWNAFCVAPNQTDPRLNLLRQRWETTPAQTVVLVAAHDPLRDEGAAYAQFLKGKGALTEYILVPDMTHGFVRLTQMVPQAKIATYAAIAAFRRALDGSQLEAQLTTPSIWKRPFSIEGLNALHRNTALSHLGIEFTEIGPDFIRARLEVNERTHQPYGILHGGISVTLAESLGSTGAWAACAPPSAPVGLDINANHIRSVRSGWVTGTTRPIHIGKSTQVWGIEIVDDQQRLVCTARLTMAVLATEPK
jgi:acetyl esterase